MASYHLCGTWVSLSARLQFEVTSTASTDRLYSVTSFIMVSSLRLISISLATLVRTLALPVSVSDIQWYTHSESVCMRNFLTFHWSARLMPFITASSSARLMWAASFVGCNQQVSSIAAPSFSNSTPIARELASTHTFSSSPCTHQSPFAGSSCFTLAMVSFTMRTNRSSIVSSSQPLVTALVFLFMVPVVAWVHPHTGRCPTSFPHREKTAGLVKTSGTSGTAVPRPHFKVPRSCRTFRPKTWAPSSKRSGSLHIRPNSASCDLTRDDDTTSLFTYMSSRYADVPSFIVSCCDNAALTMVFIIWGATFSPKPSVVRQYLLPANTTVWNGHIVSLTWTCRYAFLRSSWDTLEPSWRHSRSLLAQRSASAVNASTCAFSSR